MSTIGFTATLVRVFTTEEDWVFEFRFVDKNGNPISQAGATFSHIIKDRDTRAVVNGVAAAFAVSGASNEVVTGTIAKATTGPLGIGEWTADLLKTAGGKTVRYLPIIVRQVHPGEIL